MKRKITFIGFLPGFGGAEKSMTMVANGLSHMGNDVSIISLKDNNVVYKIDDRVEYIYIPDKGKYKAVKMINRFFSLRRELKRLKSDVVISFWLQPAIFTAILAKFSGFKAIYSERGDPTDKEYSGILGILRSIFLGSIDGFVFQTVGAQSCFKPKIVKRSVVISNPVYIQYNEYEVCREKKKTIVNVGRLHKQKNQLLLINSFARVNKYFPEYTLEIYGEGEERKKLQDRIIELGLEKKVLLKGTEKNLFPKIKDASLFVLSSDYEGMPNALMEAMALGIPCISTDCSPGGARELISNNCNGVICNRNDEQDLTKSIIKLLNNPKYAFDMGVKSKNICNTNSVNNILKKWNEYIGGI